MRAMSSPTAVYEEHRFWTPRAIRGAILAPVALIGGTVLALVTHVWPAILVGLALCIVVLPVVLGAATHAQALRVDEQGITLFNAPRGTKPLPTFTPWHEVQTVIVTQLPMRSMQALYVLKTTDKIADDMPINQLVRQIPGRFSSLTTWQLNLTRLAETVRLHAPHVAIVDRR